MDFNRTRDVHPPNTQSYAMTDNHVIPEYSDYTELLGESAMRYLTRWRMQMARLQLKTSSDSMIDVAERLGYQSEAAFSRAFKRVFGIAPGMVRKEPL